MKSTAHKIVSPFLALLVLLSTVSWTVDKHLCMGRVMDTSFFIPAKDCGIEMAMKVLEKDVENHCCDDESFTLEGQGDLKLSWEQLSLETQLFVVSFLQSSFQVNLLPEKNTILEQIHPPPLIVEDLNLVYKVFLI